DRDDAARARYASQSRRNRRAPDAVQWRSAFAGAGESRREPDRAQRRGDAPGRGDRVPQRFLDDDGVDARVDTFAFAAASGKKCSTRRRRRSLMNPHRPTPRPARPAPPESAERPRTPRNSDELRVYGLNACLAVFAKRPADLRKVYLTEARLGALKPV